MNIFEIYQEDDEKVAEGVEFTEGVCFVYWVHRGSPITGYQSFSAVLEEVIEKHLSLHYLKLSGEFFVFEEDVNETT